MRNEQKQRKVKKRNLVHYELMQTKRCSVHEKSHKRLRSNERVKFEKESLC